MPSNRRWMTSMVKEAAKTKIEMPWARGARRAAFIAKRNQATNSTANAARA